MSDYTKYTREDFLADESFVNYLLQKKVKDIQFWENWIKVNPQSSIEIKQAKLLFFLIIDQKEAGHKSGNQFEIKKQYSKFLLLLKENNLKTGNKIIPFTIEKEIVGKSLFKRIFWEAAAVAAILLIAISVWNYFGSTNKANSNNRFILFAKTDSFVKEVILPDGSHIQLNNYSSIEIARNYNNTNREVLLNGSAFFEVYKDHLKPFIVTAGSLKITALGTAFYIYNLHPALQSVSLLEGKVRVEGYKNSVELLPGEKALYNADALLFKDSFKTNQLLKFTNGKIQFDQSNLQEIKTILEEYFNKDVLFEGKMPKINFTGNFDSKQIKTILKALQFTYNITYRLEGQKVILHFN